jgi:plastocyanin
LAGCSSGNAPDTAIPPESPQPDAPAISGYETIQVTGGGAISGTIRVSGTIPPMPRREVNKDPNVCGQGSRDSEQLLVSSSGGLRNAVVIVEGVRRGKALPATFPNAQLDQKNCEYTPHVQVVPVNTEIAVLNSDPTLHNYHFYQNDESLFNIAQPAQGQVNRHKLEQPGFIYAECDVHGWMQAHVAVVDNPYYAITDENGRFSIAELPPGNYRVKIWHEYLGEQTQDITVASNTEAALNLDLKDLLASKAPPAITAAPRGAAGPAAAAPVAAAPGAPPAAAAAGEVTVEMHSEGGMFRFEPANLTIKAGTTVRWVNASENRHTATDNPEMEKAAGQAVLPAGVEPWSSAFLTNGQTFSKTFTVPGKYQYFCRNHEQFGMVATITVTP